MERKKLTLTGVCMRLEITSPTAAAKRRAGHTARGEHAQPRDGQ